MLEETPFHIIVTIDTKYYFKEYVAFVKSLGGRFDWNTKKWILFKEHKQAVMEKLHITFTEQELNEADVWFHHWWSSLNCEELPFYDYAI